MLTREQLDYALDALLDLQERRTRLQAAFEVLMPNPNSSRLAGSVYAERQAIDEKIRHGRLQISLLVCSSERPAA